MKRIPRNPPLRDLLISYPRSVFHVLRNDISVNLVLFRLCDNLQSLAQIRVLKSAITNKTAKGFF